MKKIITQITAIIMVMLISVHSAFAEWGDASVGSIRNFSSYSVNLVLQHNDYLYVVQNNGQNAWKSIQMGRIGENINGTMREIHYGSGSLEGYVEDDKRFYILIGTDLRYIEKGKDQFISTGVAIGGHSKSIAIDNNGLIWDVTGSLLPGKTTHGGFRSYNPNNGNRRTENIGFPYSSGRIATSMGFTKGGTLVISVGSSHTGTETWYYRNGSWKKTSLNGHVVLKRSKNYLYGLKREDNSVHIFDEASLTWIKVDVPQSLISNNIAESSFFSLKEDSFYAVDKGGTGVVKLNPNGTAIYYGSVGSGNVGGIVSDNASGMIHAFLSGDRKPKVYRQGVVEQTISGIGEAVQEAKEAAENVEGVANQLNTTMNTIISPKLTKIENSVFDNSGNTALSMSRLASQNASNAKTSADTAAANALTAANRAQQAIDHTWESSENKSAATLSKEARDKANEAVETINEVSSNLDEKIDTLQNNITNIQNFIAPSLMKVSGFKNATATRSNSFNVMLDYSGANEYRYKLNNGGWSSWISLSSHDSNGYVSIGGVSTTGHHTATIEIRYNGGDVQSPVARGSISFFKL